MIVLVDSGSTKADWIVLDASKKEVFRTRTSGLNPVVIPEKILHQRILANEQLIRQKDLIKQIFFYGAGCGTEKPSILLSRVLKSVFLNAKIVVKEDLLAAVYASSGGTKAIVCILGTGSNSCYFDGKIAHTNVVSLGYILMDEASGNYFGKKLLQDYFYKKMPKEIARKFEKKYNLDPDEIKRNLYQEESPNAYLGHFAQFMFDYQGHPYIEQIIEAGFIHFFEYRILPYRQPAETPIYFIGSIAYFFSDILQKVAQTYGLKIAEIIRRPIDNLIAYHQKID